MSLLFVACAASDSSQIEYGKAPQSDKKISKILKDGKLHIEVIRDDKGRVAQMKQYVEDSDKPQTTTFRYNSDNQLIEREYRETYSDHYVYKNGSLLEMRSENSANPEWSRQLIYHSDSRTRILKADVYHKHENIGYILFEYDENDNTTARKEYLSEYPDGAFSEYRFSYTKGFNPLQELYMQPLDVHQPHNPASSYFHVVYMSSLPTTVFSKYQYDEAGYPVSRTDTPKSEYQQLTETLYTFIYR